MLAEIRNQFAAAQVTIFKPHITRRCPDQTAYSVLFLELAHVILEQGHIQVLTQQARQLSFTCASRTQEQKAGHGLLAVANAGKVNVHSFQHRIHSSILSV